MNHKLLFILCFYAFPSGAFAGGPYECFIEPSRTAEVSSPIAGVLERVHVDRGDTIKKGQILAELISQVEIASLEVARARAENHAEVQARELSLEYERKRLARQEELRGRGIVSEQEYELVEGATELALAELEVALEDSQLAQLELLRAEAIIGQRKIISPFDGIVVDVHVDEGEYAADDESVLSLMSVDELHVEAYLPVTLYGSIHIGDRASVMTELNPGNFYQAEVDVVDPAIDPASGTFGVRLVLPNESKQIPPGLRCEMELLVGQ